MKKITYGILFLCIFVIICVPVGAVCDLETEGTSLLEELLDRQFESYMVGELIETSDIFSKSESTDFYNAYLYYYTGRIAATEKYWDKYDYAIELVEIDGNTLTFSANLDYWDAGRKWPTQQFDFEYVVTLTEIENKWYISEIHTNEFNYEDFERLYSYEYNAVSTARANEKKTTSLKDFADFLIADTVTFNATLDNVVVSASDVVDMDAQYEEYKQAKVLNISAMSSTNEVDYDAQCGREYAEAYCEEANSCFKDYSSDGDCTNFVSQCIWAAYGGWQDGDTSSVMRSNIRNRVRMTDEWYGVEPDTDDITYYASGSWVGVVNLWSYIDEEHTYGPQGTLHNNGSKATNLHPSSILTGQVLQVRNGSTGRYSHSVYVVGGVNDSFENIRIAQHTNNGFRYLDDTVYGFGTTSNCYMRQIKFLSAEFED